ncbi:glycoprotein [Altai virus]|nr:glycoprotein [Altai virus]
MILLSLLLVTVLGKEHYNVDLQCPHDTRQDTGFTYGSIDMPGGPLQEMQATTVESSCPFEMHPIRKAITSIKQLSWQKTSSTGADTNAADGTFETRIQDSAVQALCLLDPTTANQLTYSRKALACIEYSCNRTMCIPTIHVIVPQAICQTVRSCSLTWQNYKVMLNFERTFCPHGIITGGNCFQPMYQAKNVPHNADFIDLRISCFLTVGKPGSSTRLTNEKIVKEIEHAAGKTDCTDNSFEAFYTCFFHGYSLIIHVPRAGDTIADEVIAKMVNNTHGEDHDKLGSPQTTMRIAGKKEVDIKASPEKLEVQCFSGSVLYTSNYVYPKKVDQKYVTLLTEGVIPKVNYSTCDKKAVPVVWQGSISVPGFFEHLDPCKVFCSLTGPGAGCEAFSPTGIFNISSPTCLIGKLHRYKQLEDQISFVCQRVDTDIIVYCNGQKKVIKTETLIIGQCIYTITSIFSLMPKIAHSIAVEICVTGVHGWAAAALIITFCFGWLLIPSCTWCVLQFLKGFLIIFNKHTGTSRWNQMLAKLKEEFHHTVGNTTCKYCYKETLCPEELSAHNTYCEKGTCPYCMKDIGQSGVLLNEHAKVCLLSDKFIRKIKDTTKCPSQTTRLYRQVGAFRYRNRCYIAMVWTVLLVVEGMIWAVSATQREDFDSSTAWYDTAHGVGHVPLQLDYELDFSLSSASSYVHKRYLVDPKNPDRKIPFTVTIGPQTVDTRIQILGRWMDAELNINPVFHCYGACAKYAYPWQHAACSKEHDYQYQSGWACNPSDCPGVGTGCTACAVYIDKLVPKATVIKLLSIKYTRHVCVQIGTEQGCKTLDSTDCYNTNHGKVCLTGTTSNLQVGDTLVFLGPIDQGAIIVRQWCTSSCKFGDPGDIMDIGGKTLCPEFEGAIERVCRFPVKPTCTFQGNTVSGYKRFLSTKDSFVSVNITQSRMSSESLSWTDASDKYRDHVNVVVSKDVDFEELSENPCHVDLQTLSVEGSWGSGIGFKLTCSVSLTECSSFLTTIKACDNAICYGGVVAALVRGSNSVLVQGRGGHSGSQFKCCHDDHCSATGLQASAPHLERIEDSYNLDSLVYNDGAPKCGASCWFVKIGEWLKGILSGNWWVILLLVGIMLISLLLLGFLCPARRSYK